MLLLVLFAVCVHFRQIIPHKLQCPQLEFTSITSNAESTYSNSFFPQAFPIKVIGKKLQVVPVWQLIHLASICSHGSDEKTILQPATLQTVFFMYILCRSVNQRK